MTVQSKKRILVHFNLVFINGHSEELEIKAESVKEAFAIALVRADSICSYDLHQIEAMQCCAL